MFLLFRDESQQSWKQEQFPSEQEKFICIWCNMYVVVLLLLAEQVCGGTQSAVQEPVAAVPG
jgi:hypothetical protein